MCSAETWIQRPLFLFHKFLFHRQLLWCDVCDSHPRQMPSIPLLVYQTLPFLSAQRGCGHLRKRFSLVLGLSGTSEEPSLHERLLATNLLLAAIYANLCILQKNLYFYLLFLITHIFYYRLLFTFIICIFVLYAYICICLCIHALHMYWFAHVNLHKHPCINTYILLLSGKQHFLLIFLCMRTRTVYFRRYLPEEN